MHSILTHAGVYLSQNGEVLADNDTIIINTKIDGNGDNCDGNGGGNHGFLVCHTDKSDCCCESNEGEWYSPDSCTAQSISVCKFDESVTRSNKGTVNLAINIAENDFMSPLTLCCTVPDATGINRTVCTNSG